jgi:hypothetical protein
MHQPLTPNVSPPQSPNRVLALQTPSRPTLHPQPRPMPSSTLDRRALTTVAQLPPLAVLRRPHSGASIRPWVSSFALTKASTTAATSTFTAAQRFARHAPSTASATFARIYLQHRVEERLPVRVVLIQRSNRNSRPLCYPRRRQSIQPDRQ